MGSKRWRSCQVCTNQHSHQNKNRKAGPDCAGGAQRPLISSVVRLQLRAGVHLGFSTCRPLVVAFILLRRAELRAVAPALHAVRGSWQSFSPLPFPSLLMPGLAVKAAVRSYPFFAARRSSCDRPRPPSIPSSRPGGKSLCLLFPSRCCGDRRSHGFGAPTEKEVNRLLLEQRINGECEEGLPRSCPRSSGGDDPG